MSEDLARCPFCQSAEVSMSYSATLASPEPSCRFIECEECAAMGPACDVIDGADADAQRRAADAWNTRAHPSAREMSPEDVERVRIEVIEACARVAETRYEFETSGMPDRCFDLQVLAQRNAGCIIASAIRAQVEREGDS